MIALISALLPILSFSIVQTVSGLAAQQELRNSELAQESQFTVYRVDQELDRIASLLKVLPSERPGTDDCGTLIEQFEQLTSSVTLVTRIKSAGQVSCTSQDQLFETASDSEWLDHFSDGQDTARIPAALGERSDTYDVSVVRALREGGEIVELIFASVDIGGLIHLADAPLSREDIKLGLVNKNGAVFDHPDLEKLPLDQIRNSAANVRLRLSDGQGGQMTAIARPIAGTDIYAVLYRSAPSWWQHISSQPFQLAFLPFVAFLSAGLAIWWAVESLVLKWLRRLQRVSDIYGAGRLGLTDEETISKAPREIADLATGLDGMADRIAERQDQLEAALNVRDAAIKETHHRVKNNLQIVSSFLNLEARNASYEETRSVLSKARNRISALSIVHQTLYQYERLAEVQTKPFLELLLPHLQSALLMDENDISLTYAIEDALIGSDDANPLALLILELITNSVKHAFNGAPGEIGVSLRDLGDALQVTVKDNGMGRTGSEDGEEGGTGSRLITAFVRQLRGDMDVTFVGGRQTTVRFPKKTDP